MKEVVVLTGAIRHAKLQSNRHHQQTNTQFFTGRMPFLLPNQQCQSTEGGVTREIACAKYNVVFLFLFDWLVYCEEGLDGAIVRFFIG